jgi:hypothetical protein
LAVKQNLYFIQVSHRLTPVGHSVKPAPNVLGCALQSALL